MKPVKTILLCLVVAAVPAAMLGKDKKPYKLPAVFEHAQYVYVEAVDGQEFDPQLYPEDRKAISDVYQAVYHWKRYTLTTRRDQADLIFVVRKGRLAEGDVGVRVHAQSPGAPNRPTNGPVTGTAVSGGGEVGPPDDLLEVYEPNPGDPHGSLLWIHTRAGGLDAPDLTLFKQLKGEIERAYPPQTASKAQKP